MRRGGRLAPVQLPLPLSLSPSPVRVTRPGGGQLHAVCPRAESWLFRSLFQGARPHRPPPPLTVPRSVPPSSSARLAQGPPHAVPEGAASAASGLSRGASACSGLRRALRHRLLPVSLHPHPHPAPRAPGGRGQVAPAPGGSRYVPSVCGGLRAHRQAHVDCLSKMHGVPMDPSATFPPFCGGLWGRGHMCTPLRAQLPLSPLILSPPWGVDVDQRLRPPGPLPAGCLCPA